MKVALVQLPIIWEDKAANFSQVDQLLATNFSDTDSGLIVLPELFATGFTMDAESIAEDIGGETEQYLSQLAKQKQCHVVGGMAYKNSAKKPTNCAVVANPDGEVTCRYEKSHPFTFGGEHEHYSNGDRAVATLINDVAIAPVVCYDLRFPELFRQVARQVQVFVVIANWPSKRESHWVTLLKARAIENQAYVIGVNRCGEDPNLTYPGRTMLIDYQGEIVADAGSEAGVVEAVLDLPGLQEWREAFPALQDQYL